MLKTLLKKQMTEIFRSYFYNAKKNKAYSKGVTAAYIALFILLMVGILGGMFTFLSLTICAPMAAAGMDWLYFAIMGLISILLGAFGSVFNTFSSLYLSKDNDLLLSLPIPTRAIIFSRLLSVYFMGLMYSGIVILPAIFVYWFTAAVSVPTILGGIIFLLLISVFVLTLSCALGWVVAKISLKMKNKSMITVLASLLFIGIYYFLYFKAQTLIGELLANVGEYGEKIKTAAYPVYLFGQVGTGDFLAVLLISILIFSLFALMYFLLSRSFLKIATSSGYTERRIYKEKPVKQKSASFTLLCKEFRRFTASPNYMLNCGFGILFLPLAGMVFLWKGPFFFPILNDILGDKPGSVPIILCTALCLLASMNDMTAPSISLEGKSLWIAQSLPVSPWQILRSKLALQLLLTGIPALFCIACIAWIYPYPLWHLLFITILVLSFVLLSALFGLCMGLKMPNLSWTNEIAPIKQSACVAITLLGGWIYAVLMILGFLFTKAWNLGDVGYMMVFSLITLLLSACLYQWLKKRGCRLFAAL